MSCLEDENKWAIQRYAIWDKKKWNDIEIDDRHSYLILTFSQLIIVSKDVALESLHLLGGNEQYELFYANASIEVSITNKQNTTSKFRICLADGFRQKSNIENCFEVVQKLKEFMKITQHPSHRANTAEEPVEQKHSEVARKLLEEGKFNVGNAVDSFMKKNSAKEPVQRFLLDLRSMAMVNKALNFLTTQQNEDCS